MTGRWPIGMRIAAAVPMAIFDITNDSTLLPGYNITYNIVDSSCEPEKGLRGMVGFKTADLFIGPACSVVAEPTALLAKIWNKPIVTYAASSNKFINKYIYSTLSTITAYARRSEKYTPKFVLQILKEFHWNILAIVSSSEVEWKTMAEKIRATMEPSAKVSMFENYDNKYPQFERILQKGKEVSRGECPRSSRADVFYFLCGTRKKKKIGEVRSAHRQEPITRSVQLPYFAYTSALPQIKLFLASFFSTFSSEN